MLIFKLEIKYGLEIIFVEVNIIDFLEWMMDILYINALQNLLMKNFILKKAWMAKKTR